MGLLDSLFGGRSASGFAMTVSRAQQQIFGAYGVANPTDAQKFRTYFSLCIAGIAILNAAKGAQSQQPIDALLTDTQSLVKTLQFSAGELTLDATDLAIALADFPAEFGVNQGTRINGTAGFDAALNTIGQSHTAIVLEKSHGPFGMPASAGLYVGDFIFGEGKSRDHFMELTQAMSHYAKTLAQR